MAESEALRRLVAYVGRANFYPLNEQDTEKLQQIPEARNVVIHVHGQTHFRKVVTFLALRNGRIDFRVMDLFRVKEIYFERDEIYENLSQIACPHLFLTYGFVDRVSTFEHELVVNLFRRRLSDGYCNYVLMRRANPDMLSMLRSLGFMIHGEGRGDVLTTTPSPSLGPPAASGTVGGTHVSNDDTTSEIDNEDDF